MAVSEAVDPDEFGLFLQENGKINLNRTDSFTLFDQILAIKDKEVDKAYEQEKKHTCLICLNSFPLFLYSHSYFDFYNTVDNQNAHIKQTPLLDFHFKDKIR